MSLNDVVFEPLRPCDIHCKAAVRGYAVKKNGVTLAVFGLKLEAQRWVLFSEISPEVRAMKRIFVIGARLARGLIESTAAPVHSLADPEIEGSAVLLKHIGFKRIHNEVWIWPR